MTVKDISLYERPKPYLAISTEDGIYEVPLSNLFNWVFKSNKALEDYSLNHGYSSYDLYQDLESLGYPIKETIDLYINSKDYIDKAEPIPQAIYPIVLRYYEGKASFKDLIILSAVLGIDPTNQNPDFPEGEGSPFDDGFTPPF